jgi:molecular chaperone GrpE
MTQLDPDTRIRDNEQPPGSRQSASGTSVATSEDQNCLAQLEEARRQAEEFRNKYLRAAADVENARKQAERDAAARATQERRRFLSQFLDVADSLERALSLPGDAPGLHEGVKLSLRQMQQALERAGAKRMEVKAGDTFDPVYHEAVEVRAGDAPYDQVVELVRSGYMHNDDVLRPAQVIVARGQR